MADTIEGSAEKKKLRSPRILREISRLMVKLTHNVFAGMRVEHAYKVKVAKLEKERKERLQEIKEKRDDLVREIHSLMSGNRDEIEKTGKSVTLVTGQVGWRGMKPAIEIASGFTEKEVIESFMRRHRKYLRFKPELNRQQLLQDYSNGVWKALKGIAVRKGEEFYISLSPRGKDKPETITVPLE